MDGLNLLLGIGAFAILGTIIVAVISLLIYVVNAIAIKKYLTALGSDRTWAGWIPIFGNYEMFNAVIDENDEPVLKRVFNINIDDKIAKWYPVACFIIPIVAGKIFDSYSTRVIANIISSLCSLAGIVGLSASLAAGFALLENKSEKDTRVFAVVQSIIGILFWIKAFQLSDTVVIDRKTVRRDRSNAIKGVMDSIENEFTGKGRTKKEDSFVEEAIKRVKLKITSDFAETGGTKKVKINDIVVKFDVPAHVKNKHKVFIEDYNSEGDDLEITLEISE